MASAETLSGIGLSIWKPAPEYSPDHVRAEGTVGLHFIKAAAALSVGRSAAAEESITAILQSPTLVIRRVALACVAGRIAVLGLAAMIMPWLAAQKRQLSIKTGSAAFRADAGESAVCGYLALIALAGLAVNAFWRMRWADPVAGLALLPLILREGWEAWKGEPFRD